MVTAGYASAEWFAAHRVWYDRLLDVLRPRARTVDDIVRQSAPYFGDSVEYDPDAMAKQWKDPATADILADARGSLATATDWDARPLEEALRGVAERRGIGAGKLFQPLRVALTGSAVSPGIFDVLILLGRDRSLLRLDAALEKLRR
jgi:glutamyl-tRNA synthetase